MRTFNFAAGVLYLKHVTMRFFAAYHLALDSCLLTIVSPNLILGLIREVKILNDDYEAESERKYETAL